MRDHSSSGPVSEVWQLPAALCRSAPHRPTKAGPTPDTHEAFGPVKDAQNPTWSQKADHSIAFVHSVIAQ